MSESTARAQRFLRWLYDDQAGYIEIVAGRANLQKLDKIDLVMNTRRWCYYDPERPDLLASAAAYVVELANDYGNVYCGVRLYTAEAKRTNTRAEKHTKPSRIIFIDDAPAAPPIPYTASIQTSEHSRHAYYKCDKPTTKDDARRAAAALGGDPSGVDLTQLVRIPGTFNTKRGQQWLVSVEPGRQPRYTLDQIRAAFPAVSGSAPKSSGAAWGEVYHAENWQNLPDGESLWRSAYIAAAGQRRPDLAKLLRNERVTIVKKDGTRDDSDSAQVAALAYNLLSANVCMPQARAIADYLYTQMRPTKTREHYRAHFDVELERYTPKHYNPQTIRSIASFQKTAPQPLPPAEYKPEPKTRARKDRPQRVSGAAGYLLWLHTQVDAQSGSVMLSQSQCAERLGCCIRTIKRYEKALSGHIERRIFAQRQAGCLFILAPDVVTTLPVDVVIASADTAQQSAENAQPAVTQIEHTPPPVTARAPAAAPPRTLAHAVRLAFDAVHVDRETGEKRRITRKRLLLALAEYGDWSEAETDEAIADERQRRQRRITELYLRDLVLKARNLRADILKKRAQTSASAANAAQKRDDPRAWLKIKIAGIYAAEEARRAPKEPQLTTHELWAQVDMAAYKQARSELRITKRGPVPVERPAAVGAPLAGVCSSQPTLEPQPAVPAGITARLHALKAQREAQQVQP